MAMFQKILGYFVLLCLPLLIWQVRKSIKRVKKLQEEMQEDTKKVIVIEELINELPDM